MSEASCDEDSCSQRSEVETPLPKKVTPKHPLNKNSVQKKQSPKKEVEKESEDEEDEKDDEKEDENEKEEYYREVNEDFEPLPPATTKKPENPVKSDLEKRFVEMIMQEQKKQQMLQKREERRQKQAQRKKEEQAQQEKQEELISQLPPEPEIRSDGFVENKVDFCENISQSAQDCSWDLEDSFDDTEEIEDSDPPEVEIDEEDQPVKIKKPKKKIEKVTLNLEALPQEMQEQVLLEQRLIQEQKEQQNQMQMIQQVEKDQTGRNTPQQQTLQSQTSEKGIAVQAIQALDSKAAALMPDTEKAMHQQISDSEDTDELEAELNKPSTPVKIDEAEKLKRQALKQRMTINVAQTEYDVIRKVCKRVCNWRLRYFYEDHEGAYKRGEGGQKLSPMWDLTWHDLPVTADFVAKLHPWQKVNMYAGVNQLCKKNYLARNLMRMFKCYPTEYDFFPKTWVLPNESTDLRNHWFKNINNNKKNKVTYIVKPDGLSQGRGIFLSRSIDQIFEVTMNVLNNNENIGPALLEQDRCGYIVQQYIDRPHLIDDLKYDLRLYVFLYGVQPLRIYLHKMAFARFCTEAYQRPNRSNLENTYMHLTNYAINQFANNYQQCEDEEGDSGHKRSLGAILNILKKEGCNPQDFMEEIKDIIVKTIISAQPYLSHLYRVCQPDCLDNSKCFQILGFDVLIDSKFKPYLLEVNASPSFGTDSPLDYKIKKNVLADAFTMLNFSYEKRKTMIKLEEERKQERILTGKVYKLTPQEREQKRNQLLQERFKHESTRMGGYELIYPCANAQKSQLYEKLLVKSNDIFDDFTFGKNKRMPVKVQEPQMKKIPIKPIKPVQVIQQKQGGGGNMDSGEKVALGEKGDVSQNGVQSPGTAFLSPPKPTTVYQNTQSEAQLSQVSSQQTHGHSADITNLRQLRPHQPTGSAHISPKPYKNDQHETSSANPRLEKIQPGRISATQGDTTLLNTSTQAQSQGQGQGFQGQQLQPDVRITKKAHLKQLQQKQSQRQVNPIDDQIWKSSSQVKLLQQPNFPLSQSHQYNTAAQQTYQQPVNEPLPDGYLFQSPQKYKMQPIQQDKIQQLKPSQIIRPDQRSDLTGKPLVLDKGKDVQLDKTLPIRQNSYNKVTPLQQAPEKTELLQVTVSPRKVLPGIKKLPTEQNNTMLSLLELQQREQLTKKADNTRLLQPMSQPQSKNIKPSPLHTHQGSLIQQSIQQQQTVSATAQRENPLMQRESRGQSQRPGSKQTQPEYRQSQQIHSQQVYPQTSTFFGSIGQKHQQQLNKFSSPLQNSQIPPPQQYIPREALGPVNVSGQGQKLQALFQGPPPSAHEQGKFIKMQNQQNDRVLPIPSQLYQQQQQQSQPQQHQQQRLSGNRKNKTQTVVTQGMLSMQNRGIMPINSVMGGKELPKH